MLIPASKLMNYPVLSLHTGGPIGRTTQEIVSPDELQIIAWQLEGPLLGNEEVGDILLANSVREFSGMGMIVDSTDELVSAGEVVRVDKVMELDFSLIGLKVVTKKGTMLGKVTDYTVDTETFRVLQLIVKRPMIKAILDPELVVGRSEIVEVDDYKITVKDEEDKIRKNAVRQDFVPNFVNPFREARLESSHTESPAAKDTE